MSAQRCGVFVTGTDTGVGKTVFSAALARTLAREGVRVAAMKPIAAGAALTELGLRNDDALALTAAANVEVPYEFANPYCFPLAASPHIAAREAGVAIDVPSICHAFDTLACRAEFVIVEGAGGWLAPISERDTMASVATALCLPVVLVVGMRLGCLNHALLTAEAVRASELKLAGWVANEIDPAMTHLEENIRTLAQRLGAELLARISYAGSGAPAGELPREAAQRVLARARPG